MVRSPAKATVTGAPVGVIAARAGVVPKSSRVAACTAATGAPPPAAASAILSTKPSPPAGWDNVHDTAPLSGVFNAPGMIPPVPVPEPFRGTGPAGTGPVKVTESKKVATAGGTTMFAAI
jgi:hypothetical protein